MNDQQKIDQHYDQFMDELASYHSQYGDHSITAYLKNFRHRISSQIGTQLRLIRAHKIHDGKMLSLGGWPGITPIILHRITGIEITLVDHPTLMNSMADFYEQNNLTYVAYDFSEAGTHPLKLKQSFDLIECCQCIEHWNFSPVPLFKYIFNELLKPQGQFFITVPNAISLYRRISIVLGQSPYPSMQSFVDVDAQKSGAEVSPHWHEYTQNDLKMLINYSNGECTHLQTASYPIANKTSLAHRLYRQASTIHPSLRENIEVVCQHVST